MLTPGEECELSAAIRAGDEQAKHRFIVANLPLVRLVARRYEVRGNMRGLDFGDLVQSGIFGLASAVERYDPDRARFSTFAIPWISHSIRREIAGAGLIHVPVWLQSNSYHVRTEPKTQLARDRRELMIRAAKQAMSFRAAGDAPEDDVLNFYACTPRGDESDPFDGVGDVLPKLLEQLPPLEAAVIRGRFGFDGDPKTLDAIGREMGYTRGWVRLAERRGLDRLREMVASLG